MTATEGFVPGLTERVQLEFAHQFGGAPTNMVRAPGRVNLIGEHTDYNEGFVLPMAIDRWTCIALRTREDRIIRLHSLDFHATQTFTLDELEPGDVTGWIAYAHGVAGALAEANFKLHGWEGVLASTVPVGAGLSSSASLELAVARAFATVSKFAWDAPRLAELCQRAENRWVGINCGIMDQLISACGVAGHAVLMDCRDLSLRSVPIPSNTSVVVLDTSRRRGLVDSAYNERRTQCAEAAKLCDAASLRDVTLAALEAKRTMLDPVTYRRARHVVSENIRTLEAAEAMEQCNAAKLGALMNESHVSLRDDFEVSCGELDAMVYCATQQEGCLGARMTGAGFGGCAIALVQATHAAGFVSRVAAEYEEATGLTPAVYVCQPSNGAEVLI